MPTRPICHRAAQVLRGRATDRTNGPWGLAPALRSPRAMCTGQSTFMPPPATPPLQIREPRGGIYLLASHQAPLPASIITVHSEHQLGNVRFISHGVVDQAVIRSPRCLRLVHSAD
jgi:hypothetical protein